MKRSFSIDGLSIARYLSRPLHGPNQPISSISSFPNEHPQSLSFLAKPTDAIEPAVSQATTVALPALVPNLIKAGYTVIESEFPKYDLARAYRDLVASLDAPSPCIHQSAIIGAAVSVDPSVIIGPGCVLTGQISVGPRCVIGANVSLVNDVTLASDIRIRNGSVIGEDAYSFGFGPDHKSARFPCFAGVRIESGVEIGNNVVISRGLFSDTTVGEEARINDLVSLGNAVQLGRRSLVMANCDISANVLIGEGCWIGQSAAIRQNVRVGDGAMVGMGSVVVKDVPDRMFALGVPAQVLRPR